MLKKILRQYDCQLVISHSYKERVDYIKEWLGGDGKTLSPYTDEIKASEYNLYLYYHPNEKVIKEGQAIFLGTPHKRLKKGIVYVIPCRDYLNITEDEENIQALDLWREHLNHYQITFVESFPYLKEDSSKLLEYLQAYFCKKGKSTQLKIVINSTTYCQRELYGVAADKVCQEARKNFKQRFKDAQVIIFENNHHRAEDIEAFEVDYRLRLNQIKAYEFEQKYKMYLDLFEIDYKWTVDKILAMEKLDELFSYSYFKKNSIKSLKGNLIKVWRDALYRELLVPSEKEWLDLVIMYKMAVPYLDQEKETKKILKYLWQQLDKKLEKNLKISMIPNDELDYRVKTKNVKQKAREIITHFFEQEVKKMINELIEKDFEIWIKVVE